MDTLVDAELRDPQPERVERIRRQIHGHRTRNLGRWTNNYYDDMAWLALALERAGRLAGVQRPEALRTLAAQLVDSWAPDDGGGIPWRKQDQFFNASANGPAGIFLARYGTVAPRATDVRLDRRHPHRPEEFTWCSTESTTDRWCAQYTYCQGVVVGLETELAVRTSDDRHARRVHRLVAAVAENMAPRGVLVGGGGGDGGLFAGITARYLALVTTELPVTPRRTTSPATPPATSCSHRRQPPGKTGRPSTDCRCSGRSGTGRPSFRQAAEKDGGVRQRHGVHASHAAERDLSVQVSG